MRRSRACRAAWGPNKARSGRPDFYNLTLTPKDPALAARQLKTELAAGDVPNAIEGFEIKKLGTGRIFERTAEELNAGKAAGKNLPATPWCCCPQAPAMSILPPGTALSTITQAISRCMMSPPPLKRVLPWLAGPRGPHASLLKMAS